MSLDWYNQVSEFSRIANKAQNELDPKRWPLIPESKTEPSQGALQFIIKMIRDELDEFKEATHDYQQADALLDIIYYTLDTCAKHGIPISVEQYAVVGKSPDLISQDNISVIVDTFECQLDYLLAVEKKEVAFTNICKMANSFAYGAGFDLRPMFDIVQNANMAKFPNGKVTLNTDPESPRYGKVEKPQGWQAPDPLLVNCIEKQKLNIDYGGIDLNKWQEEQKAKNGN